MLQALVLNLTYLIYLYLGDAWYHSQGYVADTGSRFFHIHIKFTDLTDIAKLSLRMSRDM